MKRSTIALACLLAAATAVFAADDPLAAAKDLYAAAAYEDALATLTKLSEAGNVTPAIGLQIDQYRSFCLVALGRTKDAETIVQSIIRTDPLFELSADESSPRVEAIFSQVRRQLLPGLIRDKYREAKAAVDRKDLQAAAAQFGELRRIITKAQQFGVKDDAMADLAILADGFLELAQSSAPPKAAEPVAPPPPTAETVAAKPSATPPRSPAAGAGTATAAGTAAAPPPGNTVEIFNMTTQNITPPIAIRQRVPPLPVGLRTLAKPRGTFDVLIEADGRVSQVVVRDSVQSAYDTMVVDAARQWLYKPAMKDGAPVRYMKSIALDIQ